MRAHLAVVCIALLGLWSAPLQQQCGADEAENLIAVEGSIVSADGAEYGWVVFDADDGEIVAVCDRKKDVPAGAEIVRHSGYIFPGLIDTHNHPSWNSIPMWRSGLTYENRYEWRQSPEYWDEVRDEFNAIYDAWLTRGSLVYGEVRALVGGTTMIQGSDVDESRYILRNLDDDPWAAYSYVNDITAAHPALIAEAKLGLQYGIVNRLFLHVGEGQSTDTRSLAEFTFVEDEKLTLPGVVVIHGVALTDDDLETMADNGMYLVWSPQSNLTLYGETADVVGALDAGVTVALAPDWTISGSDNLLEEMKFAYRYSQDHLDGAVTPQQLFRMATADAAQVAGVADLFGERLGKLEVGYEADLFLAPKYDPDPHRSLLKTYSRDIQLVIVDGQPVVGDRRYMEDLVDGERLDEIVVSNRKKAISMYDEAYPPDEQFRFGDLVWVLESVLTELAPLVEDEPGAQPGFPRTLR